VIVNIKYSWDFDFAYERDEKRKQWSLLSLTDKRIKKRRERIKNKKLEGE
jgi:hypothetical protein